MSDEKNNPVDYSKYRYKYYGKEPVTGSGKPSYRIGKKRRGKNFRNRGAICILAIILCFSLTLLLADYFSNGYLLSENAAAPGYDYYAVVSGSYADKATAENYATNTRSRGGAGFIYYTQGEYAVITNIYRDYDDAESVLKKLNKAGTFAEIRGIRLQTYSLSSLAKADRTRYIAADGYYTEAFDKLSELAKKFDLEEMDIYDVRSQTKELEAAVRAAASTAEEIADGTEKTALLSRINSALSVLKALNASETLTSANLRYCSAYIIMSRIKL